MALALAAVGSGSGEVPASYVLDALARRWGIPPWELERAPSAWVHRGLVFMKLEAEGRSRGR
jgi:hypothetical protein